jgi:hypothetical protein
VDPELAARAVDSTEAASAASLASRACFAAEVAETMAMPVDDRERLALTEGELPWLVAPGGG